MKRWSRGSITHIISHQILCWRWELEKWKQLELKLGIPLPTSRMIASYLFSGIAPQRYIFIECIL
jgi:hypothetical protein